jgi:hypothetical protein
LPWRAVFGGIAVFIVAVAYRVTRLELVHR